MARCTHVAWLDVDGSAPHFSIVDGHRLHNLAAELPYPTRQSPCTVLSLGARRKLRALQALFKGNNFSRRAVHGLANLYLDSHTVQQDQPTLIADCHVTADFALAYGAYNGCHETERYNIRMDEDVTPLRLRDRILAGLILPFCHLVCVFAADLGGNSACSTYLRQLIGTTQHTHIATNLLVVVTDQQNIEELIQLECEPCFTQSFESFVVVQDDQSASDLTASLRFKIEASLRDAQRRAVEDSVNFSAVHLARMFGHAVADFCATPAERVDLFAAYRHPLLAQDLSLLPVNLTKVLAYPQITESHAYDHVASCMLVQAFPVDHHVFGTECLIRQCLDPVLTKVLQKSAVQHVVRAFRTLLRRPEATTTPTAIRCELLQQHTRLLSTIATFQVCLLCLFRAGEFALGCAHAICEACACEYFEYDKVRHKVTISRCYACGSSTTLSLRLKPPTAAPSILAIDGGGVRGIVSLELLARLESALIVERVTDYADLVVGTSAGGLIALDLVVRGSTIASSTASFVELATQVFAKDKQLWRSPCSRILSILIWLFCDSKYDASVLEDVAQEIFGKNSTLFQHRSGGRAVKVGIMATTVEKSDLCIFTNYNGVGRTEMGPNYTLLRPDNSAQEVDVWKVARATTAAPGFFPPLLIEPFGALQDGGLRANNPTEAGGSEARCVWPRCVSPSVVLSVGTGYHNSPTHPLQPARSFWVNTFMPRIFRAFMASPCLHGQNSWLALLTRLGSRQRHNFLRLNVEFDHEEPALDDVDAIPHLQLMARNARIDIVPFRDRLWTSTFYFELLQPPCFRHGFYHCRGLLRCRSSDSCHLLSVILDHYPDTKIVIDQDVYCELLVSCCSGCGTFSQELMFTVKRLTDVVDMKIVYKSGSAYCVSGFPNHMKWFIDRQADGNIGWSQEACCSGVRRKRKAVPYFNEGKRPKTSTRRGYWMHK